MTLYNMLFYDTIIQQNLWQDPKVTIGLAVFCKTEFRLGNSVALFIILCISLRAVILELDFVNLP